jgi:hypothetical protein
VLECDAGEAQTHLDALQALVKAVSGTVRVTEVTSTCLALEIDAPDAAMPRLKAGLQLGGAKLVSGTAACGGRLAVILTFPPFTRPKPQEQVQ